MSHRGLTGDDMNIASVTFLYILVTMSFRGMAGKLSGNEGPRMPMDMATPKWLKDMQDQATEEK